MYTIIEYDLDWVLEDFIRDRNYIFEKRFGLPNVGRLSLELKKAHKLERMEKTVLELILRYEGMKELKVQYHAIIKSVPNNKLEFQSKEIYSLSKKFIRMFDIYICDKTLRVTNTVIPFLHNYMMLTFYFKFHILKELSHPPPKRLNVTKNCNLCSDFKDLYDSKSMCDITINIGEESLMAHKLVLVTRSPVFRAMMNNDWLESSAKTLQVTDTNLHYFDCFLKYLYFCEIDDKSYDAVCNLYMLADKYQVDVLKAECRDILKDEIEVDNVCHLLELAHLFTDDALKQKAVQLINQSFSQVCKMQEWKKICKDQPELASHVLGVISDSLSNLKQ